VTFFGVFFTPVFYTVIRKLTGRNTLENAHLPERRGVIESGRISEPTTTGPRPNGKDGHAGEDK
jgi:hypothetical protein